MKLKNQDETVIGQKVEVSTTINSEVLLKNCMGSVSFALSLLDELEASGIDHVEAIAKNAAAADCAATLKSTKILVLAAGVFGALTLQSITTNIEALAKEADFGSIENLIDDLRLEMERCLTQIPSIRSVTAKHESLPNSSRLENYVQRKWPNA